MVNLYLYFLEKSSKKERALVGQKSILFLFNNYSPRAKRIFTEPEANSCFSIISELNNKK